MRELIYKDEAIDAADKIVERDTSGNNDVVNAMIAWSEYVRHLPSAQPESLSDAYMKAVLTWLLDYQIKAAELKGRYTPYEVLSWVVNDWRKEHERPD